MYVREPPSKQNNKTTNILNKQSINKRQSIINKATNNQGNNNADYALY